MRVRATLSRGSHELRMLDRLFLRLDVTADADVMEPPAPMSAIRPAVGGAGPDGASPADPSVPGPTLLGPVPSATPSRRPPLSLALVIDHSGSMAEDRKWEFAVEAAHLVIENLSARDIVTVVGFGDVATVLSPAGLAVNSAFLRHRLTDIEPKGWTNLSAGLLEAFAQLDRARLYLDLKSLQFDLIQAGRAQQGADADAQPQFFPQFSLQCLR